MTWEEYDAMDEIQMLAYYSNNYCNEIEVTKEEIIKKPIFSFLTKWLKGFRKVTRCKRRR